MAPNIYVDFDVFKALTARRATESVTENDVLRQLFGLTPAGQIRHADARHRAGDWVAKGVRFPEGTAVRAKYKGKTYFAEVKDGALFVEGKRYDSPSAAAISITGNPVNGWAFWEARLPGQGEWKTMKSFRAD